VLAYANGEGGVRVVDVDSGQQLARLAAVDEVQKLLWTRDGRRLVVLDGDGRIDVFLNGRIRQSVGGGRLVNDIALDPTARRLAFTVYEPRGERSRILLTPVEPGTPRQLTTVAGRLDELAWSPDGRWLLAAWSNADQWLFLRMPDVSRIVTVSNVSREFDPGATGPGDFPQIAGWCC
jgi:hypothetical protein